MILQPEDIDSLGETLFALQDFQDRASPFQRGGICQEAHTPGYGMGRIGRTWLTWLGGMTKLFLIVRDALWITKQSKQMSLGPHFEGLV